MRRGAVFALASLVAGCGGASDAGAGFSFAQDPYHYCLARDEQWLIDLIARIDKALPQADRGSASYQRLFVQSAIVDGKIREDVYELVLRFTADHGGQENVPMFATGRIDPKSCHVGPMEGSVGNDTIQDAGNEGFVIS